MIKLQGNLARILFGTLVCLHASLGSAQPAQAVHLIHGQGTGGTTDALARLLANEWDKRLGRNVIVESRPGAATSLAAAIVAKAPPDGNTLLFTASGFTANPFLLKDLPFDTEKDFTGVGLVATTPYVLVVAPSLPVSTPKELVQYLKQHPDKSTVGVTSIGSAQHISAALFRKMAAVDMVFVPYKGSAAQIADVATGRVPVAFDNIVAIASQIKAGTLKPLAITTRQRSEMFPDIPTLEESGFPGFDIAGWFGALAHSAVPASVVETYGNAVMQMKQDPEFLAKVRALGATVIPGGHAQAQEYIQADLKKTGDLIKELNITLE
ncbi:tripartite tricarboxylate transporter substrate-binding protein [Orrella sp. JC864]|uniref:Bug family tripartite tricarboxylate transporter substrate binding protein n=1 Tax=Orrella sp. JC864 TaxID=3120298 RepID=UPI00300BB940